MAARTYPMSSDLNFSRKRLIDGLKFILPAVLFVAIGFAFLRRFNQTLVPAALDFATAAAVGFTAGFSTRWSLKRRAGLVHAVTALATTVSALIILGVATSGQAGLKMLTWRTDADWNGLGQVAVGGASAFLALRAWRPRVSLDLPANRPPETLAPPSRPRPHARAHGSAPPMATAVHPRWRPSWRSRTRMPRAITNFVREVPRIIRVPRWRSPRIALPNFSLRGWLNSRDSQIKVNGVTEQRCPYCLDVIQRNDPRGVRVCSICHTAHHGDCWAMTGICQVPHYHG